MSQSDFKSFDKSNFSPGDNTQLLRSEIVKARWHWAFEKIKMNKLFHDDNTEFKAGKETSFVKRSKSQRFTMKLSKLGAMGKPKHMFTMLNNNAIAQKFTNILKKQFNFLSAKQYKMINDVCYMDVDEDLKRKRKLKKKIEMNFINVADKKTKQQLKRQFTENQKAMTWKPQNKTLKMILKPVRYLAVVIMPDGMFRVSFDIFAMILIVWELLTIPIILSFQDIDITDSMNSFSLFITSFFLTDLLLNFNTAFYERGHVVTHRREIFRHYISTWFIIDIFSSFPYDIVIDEVLAVMYDGGNQDVLNSSARNFSQSAKLLRILQFIKFIRVLRLLRAFKLKRIFGKLEDYLQLSPVLNAFLSLVRLSFLIICIAHWCACGFHLVATFEDSIYPVTWIRNCRIEDEDWPTRYITSIYWALTTMTTIGYGDVTPVTNIEKIYAMFMMILSSGVFGYTMNRIGNILQSFNQTSLEYKIKVFQINQYMKRKNVPKELQARVRKYIEYTLDPDKTNQIDEKVLFQTLSKNLQDEITVCINGNIIKQYEFLYKIFSPDFLFKISFFIREQIYGPEEIIVSEDSGEEDPCIFFLTAGIVTVFNKASNSFLNILKEGSYFGEIAFFSSNKRTASVKSSDFISIFKIARSDFWSIITNENLRQDREVFCQLKDKIDLYKDHLLLNLVCYSCNYSGHVAKNCPEVHYIPKTEEIIKSQLEIERKIRKDYKRKRKKYPALSKILLIQTSAYAIRNAMFLYHEEGIKENLRLENDIMNDFLEENPKGTERLSKKIVNYRGEPTSFRLLGKNKENERGSEYEEKSSFKDLETEYDEKNKESELLKSLKLIAEKKNDDEVWQEFERIEIFTKYFIHNNFTIVKKKFIHQQSLKKNEKKRESIQNKIKLLRQKTIRQNKKIDNISENISAFDLKDKEISAFEFKDKEEKEIPEVPNQETRTTLLRKKNKVTAKRASSVESFKECERFIDKFGPENVYNIAKLKIATVQKQEL